MDLQDLSEEQVRKALTGMVGLSEEQLEDVVDDVEYLGRLDESTKKKLGVQLTTQVYEELRKLPKLQTEDDE